MNGKVKFFDQKKGFGFIVEDGTNNEYFFHITECLDKIENGKYIATNKIAMWLAGAICQVRRTSPLNE